MLDISSATIDKIIVHKVGNKLRDEGIRISPSESEKSESINNLLLKNFLAPVTKKGSEYKLYHESDIALNAVSHYAKSIFSDHSKFKSGSEAIAKHLYACSNHPNIGGGEFLVILFSDIRKDQESVLGLGLFKVENKTDYLDVGESNGVMQVYDRVGISLENIQKGALILSDGEDVLALDTLSKKTKYWIENFLKASHAQTPKKNSEIASDLIKEISSRCPSVSVSLDFSKKIDEFMSNGEELFMADLKSVASEFVSNEELDELVEGAKIKHGLTLNDDAQFDSKQLAKLSKAVLRKSTILEGVSLVISNPQVRIQSIDVKKTDLGSEAIVNIKFNEV